MPMKPRGRWALWGLLVLITIGLIARVAQGIATTQRTDGTPFGPTLLDAAVIALLVIGALFYVMSWMISGSMRRSIAAASSSVGSGAVVVGCAVRVEDRDAIAAAGGELTGLVAPKNLAVALAPDSITWWQGRPAQRVASMEPGSAIDYSVDTYFHMGIPYRGLHASFETSGERRKLPLVLIPSETLLPRLVKGAQLDAIVDEIGRLRLERDSSGTIT